MTTSNSVAINTKFRDNLIAGLSQTPKTTGPPKWLYDPSGAGLFDKITELDSYYLTNCEARILSNNAPDICKRLVDQRPIWVTELGVGTGHKTKPLIETLATNGSKGIYVPSDICADSVNAAASQYRSPLIENSGISVQGLTATYEEAMQHTEQQSADHRCVVLFPGSTLGNDTPVGQQIFLSMVRQHLNPKDLLLLGLDHLPCDTKKVSMIEDAYRDETTARFITNILTRANAECGADFDLNGFKYHASYNPAAKCIEMWLISSRTQVVIIDQCSFEFDVGEPLLVERSHKFSRFDIERRARQAGFRVQEPYLAAPDNYYLVVILEAT